MTQSTLPKSIFECGETTSPLTEIQKQLTTMQYAFEEIALNAEINSTEDYEGENNDLREMFYSSYDNLMQWEEEDK